MSMTDSERCDPSIAQLVHVWDNGLEATDSGYRGKALYRTMDGTWFIQYRGGSMIDSSANRERIVSITSRTASDFLLQHASRDVLERCFPNMSVTD
jgi:hypothetical protein